MKNITILLVMCIIFACTKFEESNITFNTQTTIAGDSISINFKPNINIVNHFVDSSKTYIVINQYGDSIYIPISVVNNLITTLNNNNTNNNTVTVTNPPTNECVEIPGIPIVTNIIQPLTTSGKGSVVLTNLPTDMWILQRSPDNVYTIGVGASATVNNLDPRWASNNGAKCYTTGYKWKITNICWHTSEFSAEIMIATP
jgi:hypothetical protein